MVVALAAVLVVVVLVLVAAQPDPRASAPPPAPRTAVPRVGVDPPSLPRPRVPDVEVDAPSPPRVPRPSAPSVDLGRGRDGRAGTRERPAEDPVDDPRVLRRTVVVHDHHLPYRLLWGGLWMSLAVAFVVACVRVARRRRPAKAALVDSFVAVTVAVVLVAAAITIPSAAGAPLRAAPVTHSTETRDDGTRVITTHRHLHHLHPPMSISVPLLLAGLGLTAFAAGSANHARRGVRGARYSA